MRVTKDIYGKKDYPEVTAQGKTISPLPDSEMLIVIPTLNREDNQLTFSQLPDDLKEKTYLVTKESRWKELRKHNPEAQIITLPEETTGIADTRQRCIDSLPKGKVWMIDDSVRFQKRNDDDRVLGKASHAEIQELYDVVSHLLDYYPQVGTSDRPGNNRCLDWKKDVSRAYTLYGLRTDVLEAEGITFDGLWKKYKTMFYEDYYLTLSLFAKGYSNTVVFDFVSDVHVRNNKGGNSLFRNNERLKESIESLEKEFPGMVKKKEVESNWEGIKGIRYEPRISWKKTFEKGIGPKERKLF